MRSQGALTGFGLDAGLAVWSTIWGSAATAATYVVMRRVSGSSGRARPIAVACAAGIWAAGYRVQAFPVRCRSSVGAAALRVWRSRDDVTTSAKSPHDYIVQQAICMSDCQRSCSKQQIAAACLLRATFHWISCTAFKALGADGTSCDTSGGHAAAPAAAADTDRR